MAESTPLEQRVTRTEERLMNHRSELNSFRNEIRNDIREIKLTLARLSGTETRNKWLLIGIGSAIIVQQMGLADFLKAVIL